MELLVGAAFAESLGHSPAPEVLLFKRFQQQRSLIDQTKYQTGADVSEISDTLKQEILTFAQNQLLC
jgi:hypothetical protein